MRVVIVGAGISGLALALGLQHRGHDVTVIEEADGLRTGGAALALWYNGRAALANLGCDLNSVGCTIELLDIRSSNGRLACRIDAARLSRRFGFEPLTIGRGELIEELASHLGSGTVLFGAPCRGVDQPGSSARVFLDGGSYLDADLVVGADGHRSVMRRLFASPVPATPTGWSALQGLTRAPLPLAEGTTSTFVAGRGGAVGLMPAGQGLLQWWFDVRWPPEPRPTSTLEWLRERFRRWAPPVRDLLEVINDDEIEPFPHVWHRVPPRLHSGRVALIGDAVHAMPPVLAQGANQSIEDAWILVRELGTAGSLNAALVAYQRERRGKVAAASRGARAPMLPLYAAFTMGTPRMPPWPSRIGTWAWGALIRSSSSTLPVTRSSQ